MPDDAFDVIMKIHVRAPFRLIRAAAPYMRVKVSCRCSYSLGEAYVYHSDMAGRRKREPLDRECVVHFWSARQCRPGELRSGEGGSHGHVEDDREGVGSIRGPSEYHRFWLRPDSVCSKFTSFSSLPRFFP